MNKILCYITSIFLIIMWVIVLNSQTIADYFNVWSDQTIRTNEETNAISTVLNWAEIIWDPIRQWIGWVVKSPNWEYKLEWIVDSDWEYINSHEYALTRTLQIIKNAINWALWVLALVALIYLLIMWFMMLTAAGDDSRHKKWLSWIKRAAIAIAWIWLSRFIVSFIFWVIRWIASM